MRNSSLSNLVDVQGIGPFRASGGRFSSEDAGELGEGGLLRWGSRGRELWGGQRQLWGTWAEQGARLPGHGGEVGFGPSLLCLEGLLTPPRNSLGTPALPIRDPGNRPWGRRGRGLSLVGPKEGDSLLLHCDSPLGRWVPWACREGAEQSRAAEPAGPVCAPSPPPSALHALQG